MEELDSKQLVNNFEKWWDEHHKGMLAEHMAILESTIKAIAKEAWEASANKVLKDS